MSDNLKNEKQNTGQLNSVQLNVLIVIDMHKAAATGTLKHALYMMDNSLGGTGQGTPRLRTVCKQGQVINWIIKPMDMERREDGSYPPMPRINNIVFLDDEGDEDELAEIKVCSDLKVYGSPDLMRSPLTPVYSYWAGTVMSNLPPGVYNYRFILELEQEGRSQKLFLNSVEKPSLQVISVE